MRANKNVITAPDVFEAVFEAHYVEIRRYIGRRLDPDVAEDLAAETFLIAFRQREHFDSAMGGVRPWLYGIATNLIGRHLTTRDMTSGSWTGSVRA
ncbi:sigma factor [Nonomuraea sp. NPDC048881]|uniref:RNA polymerase sigma factor n=1 Tax=Nonomuraea sp. NPDC048881 TaxID=3155030 RepID=UPI00340C5672